MLTSAVWILAGVTAWCVASLTLALVVGPMISTADRRERRSRRSRARSTVTLRAAAPLTVASTQERRAA